MNVRLRSEAMCDSVVESREQVVVVTLERLSELWNVHFALSCLEERSPLSIGTLWVREDVPMKDPCGVPRHCHP